MRAPYPVERCAYRNMMDRCYRVTHKEYHRYGGRGITVCDEWRLSVDQFLKDMGPRPKGDGTRKGEFSLDRVNNELGYCKENCQWSDRFDQMSNQGVGLIQLTSDGVTGPIRFWAELLGVTPHILNARRRNMKNVEEILRPGKLRRINTQARLQ